MRRWWWWTCVVLLVASVANAQLLERNPAGHPVFVRQDAPWTLNDLLCVTAPNEISLGGACNALGGEGVPGAQYVVMDFDDTLSAERKLTAGTGLALTDGGANSPVTLGLDYSATMATNSLGAGECVFDSAESGILCEGTTANADQIRLFFGNPATPGADITISLPHVTTTLVGDNFSTQTWGSGAPITWTYDVSAGTDPVWTITNGVMNLSAGELQQGGTAVSLAGHAHAAGDITSGTLALARGGTNQGTWTQSKCVRVNDAGTALESAPADCGTGGVTGSGTDTYIPRWNGTTALENSALMIADDGTATLPLGTTVTAGTLRAFTASIQNNAAAGSQSGAGVQGSYDDSGVDGNQTGNWTGVIGLVNHTNDTYTAGALRGGVMVAETQSDATTASLKGVHGEAWKQSGTGNVTDAYGGYFWVHNQTGTITNGYGVYIADSDNSGTITNDYALYTAGEEPTALGGPLMTLKGDATYTADFASAIGFADIYTMNYSGGKFYGVRPSGSVVWNQAPAASNSINSFNNNLTVKNANGVAMELGTSFSFHDTPTYTCDGAACTMIAYEGYTPGPTFSVANSGTLAIFSDLQFTSVGVIGTGVSIGNRMNFRAAPWVHAGGAVDTDIGLNVEGMSATTSPIGIRNYSSTVLAPRTVQTVTASAAITVIGSNTAGTTIQLQSTGNVTVNATPSIASPPLTADCPTVMGLTTDCSMDGMFVILVNVDSADSITLRDETDLTGSNLRLPAAQITLAPKQTLELTFNAMLGDWVAVGGSALARSGSGTDNHLVRWDGASNLQDSNVTVADTGELTNAWTSTGTGNSYGGNFSVTGNHASGSPVFYGVAGTANSSAGAAANGIFRGVQGNVVCATTTNACALMEGMAGVATKTGSVSATEARGVSGQLVEVGAGDITTGYTFYAAASTGSYGSVYAYYSAGTEPSSLGGDLTLRAGTLNELLTSTLTSGTPAGVFATVTADPASATTATYYGLRSSVSTGTSANANVQNRAVDGIANCNSSNGCASLYGLVGTVSKIGAGVVTNAYGVYAGISNANATGAITNAYGVYVADSISLGGGFGTEYALYTAGEEQSSFGGDVNLRAGTLNELRTSALTSGGPAGITATMTADPASATTATYYGASLGATTGATAASGATLHGMDAGSTCATSNGCALATGVSALVSNTGGGTLTTGYGLYGKIVNTGTITTAAGIYLDSPANSGTIGTLWGIYQAGAEASSFGGNVELRAGQFTDTFATATGSLSAATVSNTYNGSAAVTTTGATITSTYSSSASNNNGQNYGLSVTADSTTANGLINNVGGAFLAKKTGTGTGLAGLMALTGLSSGVSNLNASGKVNNGSGINILAGGSTGGGFTTLIGLQIADQTAGDTNWSIYSGSAPSALVGAVHIGAATVPAARLHVTEPTIGNEVARFESVATNDDPRLYMVQSRGTTAGAASVTFDLPIVTDKVQGMTVYVTARCTSGAGCTAGQGGFWVLHDGFENTSGTVTELGAETAAYAADDITGTIGTPTLTVSTTNARLTGTGLANQNITWHATWLVTQVGT